MSPAKAPKDKALAPSFSTGGGGGAFEVNVAACFTVLMFTGGFAPALRCWPVSKVLLQAKRQGFALDDFVVHCVRPDDKQSARLLCQAKHGVKLSQKNGDFAQVIYDAWKDFNDPRAFTKGVDALALVVPPLSATKREAARIVLDHARWAESAEHYFQEAKIGKYWSDAARYMLNAFRVHLKTANKGKDVSEEEAFQFLRHFHVLGYDLDLRSGVVASLLKSLLALRSGRGADEVWGMIRADVQNANFNGGTLLPENMSPEIQEAFQPRARFYRVPEQEAIPDLEAVPVKIPAAAVPGGLSLLGAWSEESPGDREICAAISGEEYESWLTRVKELHRHPSKPLRYVRKAWSITERETLWNIAGPTLYDDDLERFKKAAIDVFREPDPKFELAVDKRYAAVVYGKVMQYSDALRKGLAETLALLGCRTNALPHINQAKADNSTSQVIHSVLDKAEWTRWASLDRLLPFFAEANPQTLLHQIESALGNSPCPYEELFKQEDSWGGNHITGLLWALENLAWEEEHLSRVTLLLGELADMDPGGNWANRPKNSLTTIFLPWHPQTQAPPDRRTVALKALAAEFPTPAWELFVSLLPGQLQSTSGSHKPTWRVELPEETPPVSNMDYWKQSGQIAELALDMARADISRLAGLAKELDHLPKETFDAFLEHLGSEAVRSLPEEERLPLWEEIMALVRKHTKYIDAKWALSPELLQRIESAAAPLAPENLFQKYHGLFATPDYELYDNSKDDRAEAEKLQERRRQALRELLAVYSAQAILDYARGAEMQRSIGVTLGRIGDPDAQILLLPQALDQDHPQRELAANFVHGRFVEGGWEGIDAIDTTPWSPKLAGAFYSRLQFGRETWNRVERCGAEVAEAYWKTVWAYHVKNEEIPYAVDKLLEHDRPFSAIDILHNQTPHDVDRATKALLAGLSSKEQIRRTEGYTIKQLIVGLQAAPDADKQDLVHIEFGYLGLFDFDEEAAPRTLAQQLASDPEFFAETMRILYKPRNRDKEQDKQPTKEEQDRARNVYRMLRNWKTPPGTMENGEFSGDKLREWIERAVTLCKEDDREEVCLNHIGEVLFHSPPDPDGLWIHKSAAEILNKRENERLRRGLFSAILNSRGVHWVDPTGAPEKALAEKYRQQANETEQAGFVRLAATLRDLAQSYEHDAQRIIEEHRKERMDDGLE